MQPDPEEPEIHVPPPLKPSERAATMALHVADIHALKVDLESVQQARLAMSQHLVTTRTTLEQSRARMAAVSLGQQALPSPFELEQLFVRLLQANAKQETHLAALEAHYQRLFIHTEDLAVYSIDNFIAQRTAEDAAYAPATFVDTPVDSIHVPIHNPTLGGVALHANDDADFGDVLQVSVL